MLPSFRIYYDTIKIIEEALDYNDGTIEGVFEEIERKGASLESIMTSDIAYMTVPLIWMERRKDILEEKARKNKNEEEFIQKNKTQFKKRYGDSWEKIIEATAKKLFN